MGRAGRKDFRARLNRAETIGIFSTYKLDAPDKYLPDFMLRELFSTKIKIFINLGVKIQSYKFLLSFAWLICFIFASNLKHKVQDIS